MSHLDIRTRVKPDTPMMMDRSEPDLHPQRNRTRRPAALPHGSQPAAAEEGWERKDGLGGFLIWSSKKT
ncbi:unnamed protein product, partial [Musa acuminata subsp. burmannicoides]